MPFFLGMDKQIKAAGKPTTVRKPEESLNSILSWAAESMPKTAIAREAEKLPPRMKVDDRWATEASSQFAVYVAVEKSDEPIAKTETAEEESAPPATAVADASAESVATATLVADVTEEKGSAADVKGTREAAVEGEGEKKATKKQAHHPIMKRSKRGQRAGGKGAKAAQAKARARLLASKKRKAEELAKKKAEEEEEAKYYGDDENVPNRYPYKKYLSRNPFERRADTTASRDFRKPIFCTFGNGNTKPLVSRNYMRTFNVAQGGMKPEDDGFMDNTAIYATARRFAASPLRKPTFHVLTDNPVRKPEQQKEEEQEEEVVDERFEPVLAPANIAPPEPLHGEEEKKQDELRLVDLSIRARESENAKSRSISSLLTWDLPYEAGYIDPTCDIAEKIGFVDPEQKKLEEAAKLEAAQQAAAMEEARKVAEEEAAKARLVGQQGASKPTSVKYIKFQPEAEDDLNPRQYASLPASYLKKIPAAGIKYPETTVDVASTLNQFA